MNTGVRMARAAPAARACSLCTRVWPSSYCRGPPASTLRAVCRMSLSGWARWLGGCRLKRLDGMVVEGGSVRFPRSAWRARSRAARSLGGRRLPGFVERVISNCRAIAVFPAPVTGTGPLQRVKEGGA